MPVFNGGEDLALAVQSIRAQSFENWELIIVDDGSTDGAVSALSHIDDPRIRILQDNQNRGLAVRLNEAISHAQGDYIARMDHDDLSHPDRLRNQTAFLDKNPDIDLLATRCVTISADNKLTGQLPFAETDLRIGARPWRGFHMPHPTWMARSDWFRRHRYANPAPYRCEDQELLLRAAADSQYHALDAYMLAYRVRTRTPLATLAKTRLAWARVQIAHFMTHGAYGSAVLAGVSCGVRLGFDLSKAAFTMRRGDAIDQIPSDQKRYWESYIQMLKLNLDGGLP